MSNKPMSAENKRRQIPLTFEDIARLSAELGPELLGYAVRLVSYYVAFGEGPHEDVIHAFLGVTKKRWKTLREQLIKEFKVENGRWVLPVAQKHCDSMASIDWAPAMNPAPSAAMRATLPLLRNVLDVAPGAPQPLTSIKQHLYSLAVELLCKSGRSEVSARGCIAKLLKDYDFAAVTEAVDRAWQERDQIAEPYSWIIRYLKNKKAFVQPLIAKRGVAIPARANRPAPTANFMGISEQAAARIKKRSAALSKSIMDGDIIDEIKPAKES